MSTEQTNALETIRKMAMEHHCFDADCFERRDVDALVAKGGDICDWTMVAIHADDALRVEATREISPRMWVLNVWGDHIPCSSQDQLEQEIHEALEEGATEMSIERMDEDSPNASGILDEAARKHDLRAVICEFRHERMKSLVHRLAAAFLKGRIKAAGEGGQ